MLSEDELDFEDFGDLGEVDGPELTNEELEALEKELQFENISTSNELKKAPTSTPTASATATVTATATVIAEKRKETPDTVNNTLEEGETPNDSKSMPLSDQQPKFNNYNANYKNNAYNQKSFYGQQSMPMNNMFPQFPQFSNRIYVNPKFNKGAASQQMQLQQQQQRQFMEMETQRMLLMQRQMQLQQQEQQRLADLDKKRREVAESMRKKQDQKNAENGEKRFRPDGIDNDVRPFKRQERFAPSPAGGITIKGAAAARNNNLSPRSTPLNERPVASPYDRRISTPFDKKPFEKPSITSRLGNAGNPTTAAAPDTKTTTSAVPNKISPASVAATSLLPIVSNGKSNTLIINSLSESTKEQDIRDMANRINGGAPDIKLHSNTNSATVVFPSVELAVTFRREYNKIRIGESHINISFQK